jgi:epoxyqueuosine reductase
MAGHDLKRSAIELAFRSGADLAGIVSVDDLPEHEESIRKILPQAKNVIIVASRHSVGSISSANIQVAQFDTIHTYNETARATHTVSRFLESNGFYAVAVPAFIPIDMQEPKKGMQGELCWRRVGVRAGLGSYGENGLLVTKEFGSAVRLAGLLTSADLEPDSALTEDACDHCMRCVEACPTAALSGKGEINKKLCGGAIFKYGFRFFQNFMNGLCEAKNDETRNIIKGYELRELWQTFMTGNYYYCFECQSKCPHSLR